MIEAPSATGWATGPTPTVAVLGCGYWGKNLVRNLDSLGALALVCDPGEPGRKTARKLAPKVEISAEFSDAFGRPDIDAVVIATPAESHCALAVEALRAGKDVFVEKPLALDFRQGLEMESLAAAAGRILMVGHLLEYHPAVLKLRELIAAGELGTVNYIYSNRLNFGKIRTEENALWSFAPHDIAVILRLAGDLPEEVTCSGGSFVTPDLPDVTLSCLRFGGGIRSHIFVSWLNPFKEQKLVVVGDRRMAVFNDVEVERKLLLYDQRVELRNHIPHLHSGAASAVEYEPSEPLRNECSHFLDCVRSRQQPLTDAGNGVDVLRVLQACQESMESHGRPVRLPEAPEVEPESVAAG